MVQTAYKHQKLKNMLLPRQFNNAIKAKNCHQWWPIRDLGSPKGPVTHPSWRNTYLGLTTDLLLAALGFSQQWQWAGLTTQGPRQARWMAACLFQISRSLFTTQPDRITRGWAILGASIIFVTPGGKKELLSQLNLFFICKLTAGDRALEKGVEVPMSP